MTERGEAETGDPLEFARRGGGGKVVEIAGGLAVANRESGGGAIARGGRTAFSTGAYRVSSILAVISSKASFDEIAK